MSKGGLLDLQQVTAAAKSLGEKSENGDNKVVLRYKVAVFGSAGAGKTATIATLCHRPAPEQHIETPGIQISRLVWPLSAASEAQDAQAEHEETVAKNSTFVLDFWDCGFSALTRFDYLHEVSPAYQFDDEKRNVNLVHVFLLVEHVAPCGRCVIRGFCLRPSELSWSAAYNFTHVAGASQLDRHVCLLHSR